MDRSPRRPQFQLGSTVAPEDKGPVGASLRSSGGGDAGSGRGRVERAVLSPCGVARQDGKGRAPVRGGFGCVLTNPVHRQGQGRRWGPGRGLASGSAMPALNVRSSWL